MSAELRKALVVAWIVVTMPTSLSRAAADFEFHPSPISSAERQAVSLAILYLEHGAQAWWEELSPDSPLRALGRERALQEIEVRLGPRSGSTWWLRTPGVGCGANCALFEIGYPSGLDETLKIELVQHEEWRIHSLSCLVDDPPMPSRPSSNPASTGSARSPVVLMVLGLIIPVFLVARHRPLVEVLAGASLALGLAVAISCVSEPQIEGDAESEPPLTLLGELLPVRIALASVGTLPDGLPLVGPRASQAAELWKAHGLLLQHRIDEARGLVENAAPLPLKNLLKARLALLSSDGPGAIEAYSDASVYGLDHDGLRLEAAQAFSALGLRDDMELAYDELGRMGSRGEETYYAQARLETLAGQLDRAEGYFKIAWKLRPIERRELFDDPVLSTLCARSDLVQLLELDSVTEPLTSRPEDRRSPLSLSSARTTLVLSGDLLSVSVLDGELLIPGGGALAPAGTPIEDATARQWRIEEAALARFRAHPAAATPSALVVSPQHRQQVETAARALADRHRWQELVAVTEGVEGAIHRVPTDLVSLRALALTRIGEKDQAIALLVRLAKVGIESDRRDPITFYHLGELLAGQGQLELAARLFEKAHDLAPDLIGSDRIRRLELEMDLAQSSSIYASPHFHLRVPEVSGSHYPTDLARVLEAEHKRLRQWIPVASPDPILVDLFPQADFSHAYGGSVPIAALYDGRIRVPFADLRSLDPDLVTILTHELAHAMVDQAADEEVPKWFNEGLAQHVEMVQYQLNPIPDLPAYRFSHLSLPVLEGILQGFAGFQFVDLAYTQAAWTVHYIEAKHGKGGIHRLIESFGEGLSDEEALQNALGMTLKEFDEAAYRWCLDEAPAYWPTTLRRYDKGEGLSRVAVRLLEPSSDG